LRQLGIATNSAALRADAAQSFDKHNQFGFGKPLETNWDGKPQIGSKRGNRVYDAV